MDRVGRSGASRCPCFTLTCLRERGLHEHVSSIGKFSPYPWVEKGCLIGDSDTPCAAASVASAQQAFKTPDEAASALVSAAKASDRKAIVTVLGPDGDDIVSSGDEVADAATRQKFVAAYDAKHQIAMEGDNKAMMVIGQEDFPLPIPLVRKDGMWRFDTAAGRQEILARRIGKNELDAIQASLAYVDAQNDYAEKDRTGAGVGTYAQRIISQPGKKDGLYWPTSQGEDASPLGELVAQATAQGYRPGGGRAPFHGYYFKILTKQGAAAPGGELEYVVRGKMIGGFATCRLSGRVPKFGRDDVYCQSRRYRVPEGSRARHRQAGRADE